MSIKEEIVNIFKTMCSTSRVPPSELMVACPLKRKQCTVCLADSIFSDRLFQSESLFQSLMSRIPSDVNQACFWNSINQEPLSDSSVKVKYTSRLLFLLHSFSIVREESQTPTYESFNLSKHNSVGSVFDAIFYVEILPLLPENVASPLSKRLSENSTFVLSSEFSHSTPDIAQYIQTLDKHVEVFTESVLRCTFLLETLISFKCGKHAEDLINVVAFLATSQLAMDILKNDRCNFWFERLETCLLTKLSLEMSMRILLTSLNRCTQYSQRNPDLMLLSTLYSRFLSKLLLSKTSGVRCLLELFFENSVTENCHLSISRDELWNKSLALATVLIRCPASTKPSEYYPKIANELIGLIDEAQKLKLDKKDFPSFSCSVLAALLVQPIMCVNKKNISLGNRLSKFIRQYFLPCIVQPSLDANCNMLVKSTPVDNVFFTDLRCLFRTSELTDAIPEVVWSHMELGDFHYFLRSLVPFLLEVYIAFEHSTLLSPQIIPPCRNIIAKCFASFPLTMNSQCIEILLDWSVRPAIPLHLEFDCPKVVSTDSRIFEVTLVPRHSPSAYDLSEPTVEKRLSCLRSLILSLVNRNCFTSAIWALFMCGMQRLLLYLESRKTKADTLADIYAVLGNLSGEVAEFSEDELVSLMSIGENQSSVDHKRFGTFLDFVDILVERLLILSSQENDVDDIEDRKNTDVASLLESTFSMSLSIISSVLLNNPGNEKLESVVLPLRSKLQAICGNELFSLQCRELVKSFLAILDPEFAKTSSAGSSNKGKIDGLDCSSALKQAIADVYDPMCAIKGHGLIAARRCVNSSEKLSSDDLAHLFDVFFQCLCHDDSYVHLNAASALTTLGLRYHQEVVSVLAALFCGRKLGDTLARGKVYPNVSVDVRIRIGECLCRIIRGLGDLAPAYRHCLLDSCLTAAKSNLHISEKDTDDNDDMTEEVKMRSSALSTLGQLAGALSLALSSDSGEILLCITSYLSSPCEEMEVRRAAICSLVLLLRGFTERSHVFHNADTLRDIGRTLRQLKATILDEILEIHLDLGLVEIDRLGRLVLEPEHKPRNIIKLVSEI